MASADLDVPAAAKQAGVDINEIEAVYTMYAYDVYIAVSKTTSDNLVRHWQNALDEMIFLAPWVLLRDLSENLTDLQGIDEIRWIQMLLYHPAQALRHIADELNTSMNMLQNRANIHNS